MSRASPEQVDIIQRHRRRVWALCYRMTGECDASEDLAQESVAKALAHCGQVADAGSFEAWLYRVATTTCLDWLRRRGLEGRVLQVVDPLDFADAPFAAADYDPECRLLRREDLRLGVLTTLQRLPARQRAVLILRDVLDRSTEETAVVLGVTAGNVKVLLHRARAALADQHRARAPDAPVDGEVVERFARAIESADVEGLTALLADEAWGIVDDGRGRRRPSFGTRAIARQWQNALGRFGQPDRVRRVCLNGEPALLVMNGDVVFAAVHLETRGARVVSIRVLRDGARIARLRLAGCASS